MSQESSLSTETLHVLRKKGLLSPEDLAEFLRVPLGSVYKWRATGSGPRGARVGRHVRYTAESVARWLEQQADEPRPA